MHYRWPGNVRELENVIERVITLMDGDYIEMEALPTYIKGEGAVETVAARRLELRPAEATEVRSWEEYEKEIIAHALKQAGSFNAAGKLLRLSHKTVAAKARKYGLV
jgi:transcriptional regulator with PAS, ATPase and Fis domain